MDENCYVEPLQKTPTVEEQRAATAVLLTVEGLGCPSCAARVRNSLLALTGVVEAQVLQSLGLAHVIYNPDLTDVGSLINAVTQTGADGRHRYQAQVWQELSAPVMW